MSIRKPAITRGGEKVYIKAEELLIIPPIIIPFLAPNDLTT